ncbi:dihydrofolate reductase [Xylographa trunciseda]|nr:dihydrofolate reductase [Xylographa trunciseda]
MPPLPPRPPPLTLIVAATCSTLGIGRAATLPWPPLRAEMAYFARVTRRAPAACTNALLMGRRTWDSIPARLRPLRGRVNVVVTRRGAEGLGGPPEGAKGVEGPWAVGSVREGWEVARRVLREAEAKGGMGGGLGRVFVIGGAEIYAAALREENCRRVLLTRVWTEFECDTFFPVRLGGGVGGKGEEAETKGGADGAGDAGDGGWVQKSKAELDAWVGEDVPAGRREEKGVEWEFEMWEKETRGEEV